MQRICAGSVSTHALRGEGDQPRCIRHWRLHHFNPRPPRGGRLYALADQQSAQKFQSTPSARRATKLTKGALYLQDISIHALREEGDLLSMGIVPGMCLFQSTPSARRATALCELDAALNKISIHALREEGDLLSGTMQPCMVEFQSTPSARRATLPGCYGPVKREISIHALREEGDSASTVLLRPHPYFNPRPPRGGRLRRMKGETMAVKFQSTPSARRATDPSPAQKDPGGISIHALREEGDERFPE